MERVANDEQLVRSLMLEEVSSDDIQAIREGIADADAGRVRPVEEFDAEFRERKTTSLGVSSKPAHRILFGIGDMTVTIFRVLHSSLLRQRKNLIGE